MDSLSDENMAERSQNGDMCALGELLLRYLSIFYRMASRMGLDEEDTKEAAQESCLRIIEKIDKFDTERPFRPWAMQIAHNTILNYVKKWSRKAPVCKELSNPGDVEDNKDDDPSKHAVRREMRLRLRKAIDGLPEPGKTCFILCRVLRFPHKDVQEALNWTRGKLRYHLRKSIAQVEKEFKDLR